MTLKPDSDFFTRLKIMLLRFFPLGFFLFGIYYFSIRILGSDLAYIPGDLGDARFINYILEHGHLYLAGEEKSFWSAGFMYPYENVIALSDNMIGTLPVYSFFRSIGNDRETAYQLWWITICVLNYWISYFVFKKWTGNNIIAACAAFIFSFGIFNLGQLNYMQMIIRFNIPVAIYAAYRMITAPGIKYYLVFCTALVFQFYCVMYTGFFLLYFSMVFLFFLLLFYRKWNVFKFYLNRTKVLYTLLITVGAGFLLLILMLPYFGSASETGLRLYKEVVPNLPTLQSYFFSNGASITWSFLSAHGKSGFSEWWLQDIFPGMITLVAFASLLIFTILQYFKSKKIDPLLLTLLFTSLVVFLLFTRTSNGLTLYAAIFKFPGMNSMRVLARFMHVQLFFILIAGALLLCRSSFKGKQILIVLLPLLIITDNLFQVNQLPRTLKSHQQERIVLMHQKIQQSGCTSKKALVYLPEKNQPHYITHLDMMIAAQEKQIKCVNGYSSTCPPAFGRFFNTCDSVGLAEWASKQKLSADSICIVR